MLQQGGEKKDFKKRTRKKFRRKKSATRSRNFQSVCCLSSSVMATMSRKNSEAENRKRCCEWIWGFHHLFLRGKNQQEANSLRGCETLSQFLLMAVFTQALLALVRCHLMSFSLFAWRHCLRVFNLFNIGINLSTESRVFHHQLALLEWFDCSFFPA